MSFFDNLANSLVGGNRNNDYDYSSYGSNTSKPKKTYQCQFCGRMENKESPQFLPTSPCPSRGVDKFGLRQKHVWREL